MKKNQNFKQKKPFFQPLSQKGIDEVRHFSLQLNPKGEERHSSQQLNLKSTGEAKRFFRRLNPKDKEKRFFLLLSPINTSVIPNG